MLNQGLILMCTGMGTVFSFLVILWFSVFCMGKIVAKLNELFPEKVPVAANVAKPSTDGSVEIAIAIAAAKMKK